MESYVLNILGYIALDSLECVCHCVLRLILSGVCLVLVQYSPCSMRVRLGNCSLTYYLPLGVDLSLLGPASHSPCTSVYVCQKYQPKGCSGCAWADRRRRQLALSPLVLGQALVASCRFTLALCLLSSVMVAECHFCISGLSDMPELQIRTLTAQFTALCQ
jgi:hypothetical protein